MQDNVFCRLRSIIEDSKLNLKDFAMQAGIPYRTLQDYLAGKSVPGGDNLTKLATVFSVSIDWLLTGEGPKKRIDKPRQFQVLYGPVPFSEEGEPAFMTNIGPLDVSTIEFNLGLPTGGFWEWWKSRGKGLPSVAREDFAKYRAGNIDMNLSMLFIKLTAIYNDGNIAQRAMVRGIIEEVYIELKKQSGDTQKNEGTEPQSNSG